MSGPVTVTQADREAYKCLMQDEHYDYEPAGAWHFARHRIQSEAAWKAERDGSRERERETLAVLQTAHESEAALIAERERLRDALEKSGVAIENLIGMTATAKAWSSLIAKDTGAFPNISPELVDIVEAAHEALSGIRAILTRASADASEGGGA